MHTPHEFSDIDHLLILCNLLNSHTFSFINSWLHVYAGLKRCQPMNDRKAKSADFFSQTHTNQPFHYSSFSCQAFVTQFFCSHHHLQKHALRQYVLQHAVQPLAICMCCAGAPGILWLLVNLGNSTGPGAACECLRVSLVCSSCL